MNLIPEQQQLIKDIFLVKVNPSFSGDSLLTLTQFPRDISGLGNNISLLDYNAYFDSLMMERLQIPKTEVLAYLSECLNRCHTLIDKPWNEREETQKFIRYSMEIIRNFIYLAATQIEIFPEQQTIDQDADKSPNKIQAIAMRLMSFFQQRGLEFDIFDAIYPRIEKQEDKGDTFLQTFIEVLLARQRFQSIISNKLFFYVSLMRSFLNNQQFKKKFVSLKHSPFLPENKPIHAITGNMIDVATPFGLFARPSILGTLSVYNQEIHSNNMLEQKIFSDFSKIKYKKDFQQKLKQYMTPQNQFNEALNQIFKQMLKKDTQKIFFQWLYATVVGNIPRTKLGTRLSGVNPTNISHDGLMLNLYHSMLQVNKVIIDKSNNKYQSINPHFYKDSKYLLLCKHQPINNKKIEDNMMEEERSYGTITEFFVLALELLNVALVPAIHNFKEVQETKQRIEEQLKQVPKNHPHYSKFQKQLQKYQTKFFQYYMVLLDEQRIRSTIKLLDMILFLFPTWINVDLNNFVGNSIQKYKKPSLLNYIPEHILNSVFEFHSFFCRFKQNYLQLIGQDHINSIINTACILLADNQISSNPYVCANYIELIFYFLSISKSGIVSEQLKNNPVALNNITPGLIKFYSDIAFTGSSHQFYSKYKYRLFANKILMALWKHEVYRNHLKAYSKTQQFQRFINMITTDTTYLFDETADKYDKLKQYEVKKQNNKMTPEDIKQEEFIEGQMAGCLQQFTSNIKLLKDLSAWSPETFHNQAFLTSIVPLINIVLKTLIDPTSFVANRSITSKYKFQKQFMLRDILNIYVSLINYKEDVIISEILRDQRNYKREYFITALQKATNENCTDETTLQKFQMLINNLATAKMQQVDDEDVFGQIPEKYCCSLIGSLMKDPVLLPTSGNIVDRMYIHKHLLNDERDPFNRKPLKYAEVQQQTSLKAQIDDWKKKRLQQLKKGNNETKYGKKGQKKKQSQDGGVFKENFLKYDE